MTAAISSGSAPRPSGMRSANLASSSGLLLMSCVMPVKVRLGATAFTRTPSLPWSSARARVKLETAPLEVL